MGPSGPRSIAEALGRYEDLNPGMHPHALSRDMAGLPVDLTRWRGARLVYGTRNQWRP